MILVPHVTDDTLERYAMQRLPDSEIGPLEEHLMICSECRDRLQAEIDFVTAMRDAAAEIRQQERKAGGGEVEARKADHQD